ncbi:MAG: penicillin acylase family protein [Microthrixaceae bacterium]|nr:penicillin acylase family protein [Microthrixaceae bacterium]
MSTSAMDAVWSRRSASSRCWVPHAATTVTREAVTRATVTPARSRSAPRGYGAVITRTADGVPHIRAADLLNVSFGQGWASAEDHPCDLVDQVIKVTSQRAATFGPGEQDSNLNSDFGWAALGIADVATDDWESVKGDERDLIVGFTDGWNASFEAQGADGIEDWCTGADWMRTLTPEEVYTYARSVTLLASGPGSSTTSLRPSRPAPTPRRGSPRRGGEEAAASPESATSAVASSATEPPRIQRLGDR